MAICLEVGILSPILKSKCQKVTASSIDLPFLPKKRSHIALAN